MINTIYERITNLKNNLDGINEQNPGFLHLETYKLFNEITFGRGIDELIEHTSTLEISASLYMFLLDLKTYLENTEMLPNYVRYNERFCEQTIVKSKHRNIIKLDSSKYLFRANNMHSNFFSYFSILDRINIKEMVDMLYFLILGFKQNDLKIQCIKP
jgi:hypothetical protein